MKQESRIPDHGLACLLRVLDGTPVAGGAIDFGNPESDGRGYDGDRRDCPALLFQLCRALPHRCPPRPRQSVRGLHLALALRQTKKAKEEPDWLRLGRKRRDVAIERAGLANVASLWRDEAEPKELSSNGLPLFALAGCCTLESGS